MVKLSCNSIDALTTIITGNDLSDGEAIAPYRTGSDLMTFFKRLDFEEGAYDQGFPSRHTYVKEKLEESNGKIKIREILQQAVDPRHFIGTGFDIDVVVKYLNKFLKYDGFVLVDIALGYEIRFLGQEGEILASKDIKNLIFASTGPKPEIVLKDALNNQISIERNQEYCLVYDKQIPSKGLWWLELLDWWGTISPNGDEKSLRHRLSASLASPPEQFVFNTYYDTVSSILKNDFPVLIPQVYLHYDPKTIRELAGQKRLLRQRMDFLLLLPFNSRIVIEVDGKQHYSTKDGFANPKKYAEMVSEDRNLRLLGYEVYRFGGHELRDNKGAKMVKDFFQRLLKKHKINWEATNLR